ncbi:MAG: lectin-like protein, partial [Polyangiaceae bacterium]
MAEALTPTTVTVAFPAGAAIGHTVMSGNSSLLINPGSTVGKAGDNLTVASFGSPTTTVTGLATVNGSISSVGPVVVQTLATVTGSVQSAAAVTVLPGGTVKGAVLAKQPFVRNTQSWTVNLPSTNQGNVVLALGSRSLAPGAYGDLNTLLGTTLSLRSGTYFFTSFNTSVASAVQLDESGGPVVIYVTGNASAFGNWVPSGGANPDDLLLVALGSGEVHIGSPLAGTVVAPNAEVDLQLVSAPHVGQVFAKQVDLWAGQTLQLGSFDWSYFCPLGDTDGDGVNDCTDQCPLDAHKTTPGVCGCGVSEKDSDGDGIPDCVDPCPNDPTKSVPGQCGCGNSPQPAGTACNDGVCSGVGGATGLTCDGVGQCGSPSACAPDPSCVAKVYNQFVYWICPGPATWSQAMVKCDAVSGQTLLEVDSRQENAVLADLVKTPSWTGANDQGTSGTWTWAGSSVTGKTFFAGGATVFGGYSNWGGAAPGDNVGQCGSFAPTAGTWSDTSCASSLGYVCKRSLNGFKPVTVPPVDCTSFGGSASCTTTSPSANCVPNDPNLPDADILAAQVDTCLDAGCTQPGDPGCAQCTGAAAVPPPGSTCRPYNGTLCGIQPGTEGVACDSGAQCSAGQLCAATVQTSGGSPAVKCTLCDSMDAGNCNTTCPPEVMHCGTPTAGCEAPYDGGLCREVVLCAPDGSTGILDPRLNPGSNLTPEIFDAAGVFEAGAPPTPDYPQDPACPSPPCHLGPSNGWCTYLVPTSLPQQNPGNSNPANSGSGGLIQFDFDPNLSLHFEANPLAFGESNFGLTASASLTAGATFDIPVVGKSSFDIVDALAMLTASRCQATTGNSHLKVFGLDFLPMSFKFDSDGTPKKLLDKQSCEDAVTAFEVTVDRAKKALKDAQTLLTQYGGNRDAGLVFPYATPPADAGLEGGASLCQLIAADPPAGFPTTSDCTHETPEATINRFIQFYTNQVAAAMGTETALAVKELSIYDDLPVNFVNNTEQQTLFSATFFIGPIPCLLQVQAVEGYGIQGDLNFNFNPGALLLSQAREQMADITGTVTPYANAGISLFVGVGFDIGIASASAGVEGI